MTAPVHARLGASNAHRWMNCPGSVEAESKKEDPGSVYAQEGTVAHHLAAEAWQWKRNPAEWVGEELSYGTVTEEMANAVQVYLAYIQALAAGADEHGIERGFNLSPLQPPEPMFGTTDFYAWHFVRHHLDIVDFKYGRGVLVDAEGNAQTRMYALGAWVHLATQDSPAARRRAQALKTVTVHIVQPRTFDEEGEPRITTETLTLMDLEAWGKELLERARRVQRPNAPRIPGDWCKFCRAQATCPEFRQEALAVAQIEFSQVVAPTPPALPDTSELTPEQVGCILTLRKRLEDWLSAVEARAMADIERGRSIPGWALAPKRAVRKWADPVVAPTQLMLKFGLEEEDVFEWKIRSPAQIEKLVGKGSIPDELITAESSGLKLVPADHKQALSPAAEFSTTREEE